MGAPRYDPDRRGYRIFVGNLSGVITHDDLANLFSPYGPIVDVWLASNPPGFGFVVFKNAADAEKAVAEKNSSVYLSRVIKVQHARLFKDRPSTRSPKTGSQGYTESDSSRSSRSRSSRSRSRSRPRSPSRSRSSRRWSRSSSRLSYFSRLYGTDRNKSRSSSRSRSESRARSSISMRTVSVAESDSRSKSRSPSQSRHRSRTKSRTSRRHRYRGNGGRRSQRSRRRHRRRGARAKSRHNHSSSQSDVSSGGSSPHSRLEDRSPSSSRRPKQSSSRPKSSSSRRVRQRDAGGCRFCNHCKDHRMSSQTSKESRRRMSSSSPSDRGKSNKRHRRSWKEGERSQRRSSTSSTSSSLTTSKQSMPPVQGSEMTGTELDPTSTSDHNRNLSTVASEPSKMVPHTATGSPSPHADTDIKDKNKAEPQSVSEPHATLPCTKIFAPVSNTSPLLNISGTVSGGILESTDGSAVTASSGLGNAVTSPQLKMNTTSKSASDCVGKAASKALSKETSIMSTSGPESYSVSHFDDVVSDGDGSSPTQKLPSVRETNIQYSLGRKVPWFHPEVCPKKKDEFSAKKESSTHNYDQSNINLQEQSIELDKGSENSLSSSTNNPVDVSNISDVNISHDVDDTQESQSKTGKESSVQHHKSLQKKVPEAARDSILQVATYTANRCDVKINKNDKNSQVDHRNVIRRNYRYTPKKSTQNRPSSKILEFKQHASVPDSNSSKAPLKQNTSRRNASPRVSSSPSTSPSKYSVSSSNQSSSCTKRDNRQRFRYTPKRTGCDKGCCKDRNTCDRKTSEHTVFSDHPSYSGLTERRYYNAKPLSNEPVKKQGRLTLLPNPKQWWWPRHGQKPFESATKCTDVLCDVSQDTSNDSDFSPPRSSTKPSCLNNSLRPTSRETDGEMKNACISKSRENEALPSTSATVESEESDQESGNPVQTDGQSQQTGDPHQAMMESHTHETGAISPPLQRRVVTSYDNNSSDSEEEDYFVRPQRVERMTYNISADSEEDYFVSPQKKGKILLVRKSWDK